MNRLTLGVAFLVFSIAVSGGGAYRFNVEPEIKQSHIVSCKNFLPYELVVAEGHGCGEGTIAKGDNVPFMDRLFVTWTDGSVRVLALNLTKWCICGIDHRLDSISMYDIYDHSRVQTLFLAESQLPELVTTNRTDFDRR